MRKVYVPVYLIEWSDVRPYVIMAWKGTVFCSLKLWAGLLITLRFLYRVLAAILKALWRGLVGVFAMSNPKADDDDDEEEDDDDVEVRNEVPASKPTTPAHSKPKTMFDED